MQQELQQCLAPVWVHGHGQCAKVTSYFHTGNGMAGHGVGFQRGILVPVTSRVMLSRVQVL